MACYVGFDDDGFTVWIWYLCMDWMDGWYDNEDEIRYEGYDMMGMMVHEHGHEYGLVNIGIHVSNTVDDCS